MAWHLNCILMIRDLCQFFNIWVATTEKAC